MKNESNDARQEVHRDILAVITRYTTVKALGHSSAYLCLFLCTAFWIEVGLHFIPGFPLLELTGFQVFKIMGVAILLASGQESVNSHFHSLWLCSFSPCTSWEADDFLN